MSASVTVSNRSTRWCQNCTGPGCSTCGGSGMITTVSGVSSVAASAATFHAAVTAAANALAADACVACGDRVSDFVTNEQCCWACWSIAAAIARVDINKGMHEDIAPYVSLVADVFVQLPTKQAVLNRAVTRHNWRDFYKQLATDTRLKLMIERARTGGSQRAAAPVASPDAERDRLKAEVTRLQEKLYDLQRTRTRRFELNVKARRSGSTLATYMVQGEKDIVNVVVLRTGPTSPRARVQDDLAKLQQQVGNRGFVVVLDHDEDLEVYEVAPK